MESETNFEAIFFGRKKKNSQEQGTPKGGEHPITPAIKQI